jgi:hypothetical protein
VNIRELDEESRRTGVWPPRRIILRVDRGSSDVEEPQAEAPVSVGLVDLASPSRPKVRTSPRSRHAPPMVAPERLAAGQVAPRPPLSRPPAPGSVVRRHGRIVAAPRPASRDRDEDAEFERWLAMPLAISDSDPDYQDAPVWLPEDRRLRADRRHRRITRRTRAQLFSTSAVTTLAAAGCCVALAGVLSQTETVGGSLGVPSIGLFGTRPAPVAQPQARVPQPVVHKAPRKVAKRPAHTAKKRKPSSSAHKSSASSSPASSNQVASVTNGNSAPASTRSSTPTPQRTVTPPPPPPPAAPQRSTVTKPKASTPTKTTTPKPVQAPPVNSSPSGSGSPSLGADGEPSL